LWSLQTGIVVAVGGVGLLISNGRLIEELAQPLYLVATLAIAVGIGFVISAVAAFALSRHLGLLQADSTHACPDRRRDRAARRSSGRSRRAVPHDRGGVPRAVRADGAIALGVPREDDRRREARR